MFDQGRFDLLRFCIRAAQTDEVMLTVAIHSSINAMIVNGGDVHETAFIVGAIQGNQEAASAVRLSLELAGRIRALADGYGLYFHCAPMAAGILGAARLSGDDCRSFSEAGTTYSRAQLGMNAAYPTEMAAAIESDFQASADYHAAPQTLHAHVDAQVTTIQFTHGCAEFDVSIGPGQTLVIDSGG